MAVGWDVTEEQWKFKASIRTIAIFSVLAMLIMIVGTKDFVQSSIFASYVRFEYNNTETTDFYLKIPEINNTMIVELNIINISQSSINIIFKIDVSKCEFVALPNNCTLPALSTKQFFFSLENKGNRNIGEQIKVNMAIS